MKIKDRVKQMKQKSDPAFVAAFFIYVDAPVALLLIFLKVPEEIKISALMIYFLFSLVMIYIIARKYITLDAYFKSKEKKEKNTGFIKQRFTLALWLWHFLYFLITPDQSTL